jgi:hypothetical protein
MNTPIVNTIAMTSGSGTMRLNTAVTMLPMRWIMSEG